MHASSNAPICSRSAWSTQVVDMLTVDTTTIFLDDTRGDSTTVGMTNSALCDSCQDASTRFVVILQ